MTRTDDAHRARQLNPTDELYWKSRGWASKPPDWQRRLAMGDVLPDKRTQSPESNSGGGRGFLNRLLRFPGNRTPLLENAGGNSLDILSKPGIRPDSNNPDHDAYWQDRGWDSKPSRSEMNNPNNDAYWVLKGYSERPADWKMRA